MKTIVTLGCSQSSGAEISDGKIGIEEYWKNVLAMDNPYQEWFGEANQKERHQEFLKEFRPGRKEDWFYNRTHAWPWLLYKAHPENHIYNLAQPGSGVAYVKWMYHMDTHRFHGTNPILASFSCRLIQAWKGYLPMVTEMNGPMRRKLYQGVNRFEMQPFFNQIQFSKFINNKARSHMIEYERFNQPNGAGASLYSPDRIKDVNNPDNAVTASIMMSKDQSFKKLLDTADILYWQIPNDEPRIIITHPNLPWAYWTPKIHSAEWIIESMMGCFESCMKLLKVKDYTEQQYREEFQREAERLIEHYTDRYDYDTELTNNADFVNSIVAQRENKGLKTHLFTIASQDWLGNIEYDIPNYGTQLGMGRSVENLKERIRAGTFPQQKYGHISAWANEQIANDLLENYYD